MTTVVEKDGELFSHTTVTIPLSLRKEARRRGVSISGICTEALRERFGGKDIDTS